MIGVAHGHVDLAAVIVGRGLGGVAVDVCHVDDVVNLGVGRGAAHLQRLVAIVGLTGQRREEGGVHVDDLLDAGIGGCGHGAALAIDDGHGADSHRVAHVGQADDQGATVLGGGLTAVGRVVDGGVGRGGGHRHGHLVVGIVAAGGVDRHDGGGPGVGHGGHLAGDAVGIDGDGLDDHRGAWLAGCGELSVIHVAPGRGIAAIGGIVDGSVPGGGHRHGEVAVIGAVGRSDYGGFDNYGGGAALLFIQVSVRIAIITCITHSITAKYSTIIQYTSIGCAYHMMNVITRLAICSHGPVI